MQPPLFHPKIKTLIPGNRGGADLRCTGISEDNAEWVLKLADPAPLLPITEWLCYHVMEFCGVAVPLGAIVEMPDGSQAFGSRLEGGLSQVLQSDPVATLSALGTCAPQLASVLALDLLLANPDRHLGNFLWRKNQLGNIAPYAIDYSRAFLVQGWPLQETTATSCNTTNTIVMLRQGQLWQPQHTALALARAGAIETNDLEWWIDQTPRTWLPDPIRATLLAWWGGADFHARLQRCIGHCT